MWSSAIRAGFGGAALAVLAAAASPAAAAPGEDALRLREFAGVSATPVSQSLEPQGDASPLNLAPAPRRSLQLDSNGRWGLRLDMVQPSARDQDLRDVQAGAYFRIGPRVRVGGTVNLNDKTPSPQAFRPQDSAPRVRLETNFKF